MSAVHEFKVLSDYLPYKKHTPLKVVQYKGKEYQLYEVEAPLSFSDKVCRFIKCSNSCSENKPQRIKAIFIKPSYCKKEMMEQAAKACLSKQEWKKVAKDRDVMFMAMPLFVFYWKNIAPTFKKDKQFIVEALLDARTSLQHVHKDLQKDKDVCLAAIERNESDLYYAHDDLKKDKEFIMSLAIKNERFILYAHKDLKQDKEFLLQVGEQNFKAFFLLPLLELQSDPTFIEARNKNILQQLRSLRNDPSQRKKLFQFTAKLIDQHDIFLSKHKDLLLETVEILLDDFVHFPRRIGKLKSQEYFMLEAVKKRGLALQYASDWLRDTMEVVLAAVKQDALALKYASDWLKDNDLIVLAAVERNGSALKYASHQRKNHNKMVLAAVTQYGGAIEYASNRLKENKDIILAAVIDDGLTLKEASDHLKQDKTVVLAAVTQDGLALEYASDHLKQDKAVVLAAVKQNGQAFKFTSLELQNDKEIALAAVMQDKSILEHVPFELQNDKDIILAALPG
jgi:hypothetical protein